MTSPEDLTVHLRRNAERGWIDLILAAPSAAEADRDLRAQSEALRRLLDQDMSLHEALEVQRLAAELEALRSDLRRTIVLRRSPPTAEADEERGPDEAAERPEAPGPPSGRDKNRTVWYVPRPSRLDFSVL